MTDFLLDSAFPFLDIIFGIVMLLTAFKVINLIDDDVVLKKYRVYIIIGGLILISGGIIYFYLEYVSE
ncbi:hypothetical protein KIH23_02670 [Flavobacterium sp. CYK-55]|uniref:hypothetical protein n=1 Tax=Flavobacterium sp. CYK-55 TaxID=2835529 RepID=UPI001BD07DF9|nr:hypothetical protein [Flavobacterium sp. CYK-55]MBS7786188.1 hypothetical protein [Flavobacterium sp. CYK-55]